MMRIVKRHLLHERAGEEPEEGKEEPEEGEDERDDGEEEAQGGSEDGEDGEDGEEEVNLAGPERAHPDPAGDGLPVVGVLVGAEEEHEHGAGGVEGEDA